MTEKEKFDIKLIEKMLTKSAEYYQNVIQHTVQAKNTKQAKELAERIEKAIMAAYQTGFTAGAGALWELAEAEDEDVPTVSDKQKPSDVLN